MHSVMAGDCERAACSWFAKDMLSIGITIVQPARAGNMDNAREVRDMLLKREKKQKPTFKEGILPVSSQLGLRKRYFIGSTVKELPLLGKLLLSRFARVQ